VPRESLLPRLHRGNFLFQQIQLLPRFREHFPLPIKFVAGNDVHACERALHDEFEIFLDIGCRVLRHHVFEALGEVVYKRGRGHGGRVHFNKQLV
jgi:hypothetical protein